MTKFLVLAIGLVEAGSVQAHSAEGLHVHLNIALFWLVGLSLLMACGLKWWKDFSPNSLQSVELVKDVLKRISSDV